MDLVTGKAGTEKEARAGREGQKPKKPGRPPRGSDRALSRDRILAAALEISRTNGLEQLTMRGLANALDVNIASLYWHFPSREDLMVAALERASEEIDLSDPPEGPWRERCLVFCHQIRREIRKRPEVLRIQDQGSLLTPLLVHASRTLIEVLSATGLRGDSLLLAAQTLLWQALGIVRVEQGLGNEPPPAEAVEEVGRLTVPSSTTGLDGDEWRSVAQAYVGLSFKRCFDFAIRTTLDGIEHSLACQSREEPANR